MEKSDPHSGIVGKDGRAWFTLTTPGLKIVSVDPETNKIKLYTDPEDKGSSHTMIMDKEGNLWISGHGTVPASLRVWSFNVNTEQFKAYNIPGPSQYPEDSKGSWEEHPGNAVRYGTYHLGFDSKGILWTSTLEAGIISRLDPKTGETKQYFPPGVPGIRGMAVDGHDNIWFSDFYNHRLGMLDQKTGTFKMYQPPTRGVGAYGIVVDPKTGYIWYGDQIGNYITRFDPSTQQFADIQFLLAEQFLASSISIRMAASGLANGGWQDWRARPGRRRQVISFTLGVCPRIPFRSAEFA